MKSNFVPAPRKLQSQTEDEAPKCCLHSHPEVGKSMATPVCNWWSDTSIWSIHHEMNRGLHVCQPMKYTHKIHLMCASVPFLNWCPQIGSYNWSAHTTWASYNLPEILLYIVEIAKTSTRVQATTVLCKCNSKAIETFQKCLCNQWSNLVSLRCCLWRPLEPGDTFMMTSTFFSKAVLGKEGRWSYILHASWVTWREIDIWLHDCRLWQFGWHHQIALHSHGDSHLQSSWRYT